MADTKNGGLSTAECVAIVTLALVEIADTTNLDIHTIFDCMSKSVEGLPLCPSDNEYAQAAGKLWRLLKDGGHPHA
ncbi:MAG: hypothetical protein ACK5LX_00580 [Oscillospiraceae bacterium]